MLTASLLGTLSTLSVSALTLGRSSSLARPPRVTSACKISFLFSLTNALFGYQLTWKIVPTSPLRVPLTALTRLSSPPFLRARTFLRPLLMAALISGSSSLALLFKFHFKAIFPKKKVNDIDLPS